MNPQSVNNSRQLEVCERYVASGDCNGSCGRDHPHQLHAYAAALDDYQMPNDAYVACDTCARKGWICDKKGRLNDDDPCSHCRHFGGRQSKCRLAEASYNDEFFRRLLRSRKDGFTLPYIRHDAPSSKGVPPTPLQPGTFRHDWTGKSREELLNEQDWVPSFFRDDPRPYLVAPRPTKEVQNVRARFAQGLLLGPATRPPPVLPLVWPAPPRFGRPQLAGLGNAAELTWDFNRQRYKYVFAGRTIWQPEQNVPVPGPPSTSHHSHRAPASSYAPASGYQTQDEPALWSWNYQPIDQDVVDLSDTNGPMAPGDFSRYANPLDVEQAEREAKRLRQGAPPTAAPVQENVSHQSAAKPIKTFDEFMADQRPNEAYDSD
ncbi:hypothetical protein KCU67_g1960, partial [Aureobasidium melanogenum]